MTIKRLLGLTVMRDAWSGYAKLPSLGYDHVVINQSAEPYPAHVVMPGVHRVASLLKRWLLGTYQGAVSNDHLDHYLDEFTFRFNRCHSRSRGLLFYRLLEQAKHLRHRGASPAGWIRSATASANASLHFHLDQTIELYRILQRQLLRDRLDEAAHD